MSFGVGFWRTSELGFWPMFETPRYELMWYRITLNQHGGCWWPSTGLAQYVCNVRVDSNLIGITGSYTEAQSLNTLRWIVRKPASLFPSGGIGSSQSYAEMMEGFCHAIGDIAAYFTGHYVQVSAALLWAYVMECMLDSPSNCCELSTSLELLPLK